jgi:hypothetical protein
MEKPINERIKLLAEQAKTHAREAMFTTADPAGALSVYSDAYDTKFSQLIIEETLRILEENTDKNHCVATSFDLNLSQCVTERSEKAIRRYWGLPERFRVSEAKPLPASR